MHEQQSLNNVVFSFYGPPGAGKGTLASMCSEKLNYKTLSTGELCRKHIARKTEFGTKIEDLLKAGVLVPDGLITQIVGSWLSDKVQTASLILDGYPRTLQQAKLFLDILNNKEINIDFKILFFEISDEAILKRLSNRLVCSDQNCQAVYSLTSLLPVKKGICDKCGEKLQRRFDDKIEIIKERLKHYPRHKKELLDYYKSEGVTVYFIDLGSKSRNEVFEEFKERFALKS